MKQNFVNISLKYFVFE